MTRETDRITDLLALDRTKLANQRTLLACIRTNFYFIGWYPARTAANMIPILALRYE